MGAAFILAKIGSRSLLGIERVISGRATWDFARLVLDTLMGWIGFVASVEGFALVIVAVAILTDIRCQTMMRC